MPVAGSEDFWLSAANIPAIGPREVSLASWTAPVKLGASVTLTIAGEQRALEVIDIAEMPGERDAGRYVVGRRAPGDGVVA